MFEIPRMHKQLIPEVYIPLYKTGDSGTGVTTSSDDWVLLKLGATTLTIHYSSTAQNIIFTLPADWPIDMLFAIDCAAWSPLGTTRVALWDITIDDTTGIQVYSTDHTTPSILRSNKKTLIPGHSYGIALTTNSSPMYCNSVTLVGFPVR